MRRWTTIVIVLALLTLPLLFFFGDATDSTGRVPHVALIELSGTISDSAGSIRSHETVALLRRAQENPNTKAVVVRINSGGGSVGASQEIYDEIRRTSEMGKPVVASMGDTAASGGYYIAAAADVIYANPGTLTGSIGVVFQFQVIEDLLSNIGVATYTRTSGQHKAMINSMEHPSEADLALLDTMLADILDQFVADVARGRNLDYDHVLAIADGRIMTGRQAFEHGLVDELGGLEDALEAAGKLVGIPGRPEVHRLERDIPWSERLFRIALPDWSIQAVADFLGVAPWGYHVR